MTSQPPGPEARRSNGDETVGVYVHVPFCERVCPYCDFAVIAARPLTRELEDRFVAGLLVELERRAPAFDGRRLASLYFGGGTPSLLHPESVERVVEAVHRAFPASPEAAVEITLEVNPSTLERSRLPDFRSAGVARVSVGVQSFQDPVLKRLGRAHGAAEAHRTLAACRDAGFPSLSLDLIYAAPGQSAGDLERDLAEVTSFAPEHVSAYELSVEAGTPFALARERGQLELPAEDVALAMARNLEERLAAAGIQRYEISSYARPGCEAVHNTRYWRRRPVLGIGPSAVSTDPPVSDQTPFGSRRRNLPAVVPWLEGIESGSAAEASPPEVFDAATARGEAVFLALRELRGLDAGRFAGEFGAPPRQFFAAEIDELRADGLVDEDADGSLRLTRPGRQLADTVFVRFV